MGVNHVVYVIVTQCVPKSICDSTLREWLKIGMALEVSRKFLITFENPCAR